MFRCATGDDYTLEVEQAIREDLPRWLVAGSVEAIGSWDGNRLAAVATFTRNPYAWKVHQLATDLAYRHRRQALRLKKAILDMAAATEASAVLSLVHRENVPMRQLNRKLGGVEDDQRDDGYLWCTVPVRPSG